MKFKEGDNVKAYIYSGFYDSWDEIRGWINRTRSKEWEKTNLYDVTYWDEDTVHTIIIPESNLRKDSRDNKKPMKQTGMTGFAGRPTIRLKGVTSRDFYGYPMLYVKRKKGSYWR
jgi:hypothetical protein